MKTEPEKPWYLPSVVAFLRDDIPQSLGVPPKLFARDVITLERRVATEGESFLTKTLPSLAKVFDLALQSRTRFQSSAFKKAKGSSLPAFLQGLTKRIFDDDGNIVEQPCIVSIRLVRQMLLMCKKIRKGFSDEDITAAVHDFCEVDGSLPPLDHNFDLSDQVLVFARRLIHAVFRRFPSCTEFRFGHGPGAVVGAQNASDKRRMNTCFEKLESAFRPIPTFRSYRDVAENLDDFLSRPRISYGLSRMAFVEKDSGGPRTIGLEPAEYMWCQQALKSAMYHRMETHFLTRGHVNFADQSVNRLLARDWSAYETLDMSKASDRCSYALVRYLFEGLPLWRYLDASRTPGTTLPSGETFLYRKFAPMGSAVCFPVESIVFFSLTVATLHVLGKVPLLMALKKVFVYGDDLVVPRGFYPLLSEKFSALSLKFNEQKCCVEGRFRESCGADCYDGVDVTPHRLKTVYPIDGDDQNPLLYVSLVSFTNQTIEQYRQFSLTLRRDAIERYPFLRKLRLETLCTSELPGVYWYDPVVGARPRLFNKVGGLATFSSWYPLPVKEVLCESWERAYLRESLSRGGPVGVLRPKKRLRLLDRRFSVVLRRKRFKVECRNYCQ